MLWAELAHELIVAWRLDRHGRDPADVLHLIVLHAQRPRDRAVGGVLVRTWLGPHAPESEQQHRLAHLLLKLLRQLRHAAILFHHLNKLYCLKRFLRKYIHKSGELQLVSMPQERLDWLMNEMTDDYNTFEQDDYDTVD